MPPTPRSGQWPLPPSRGAPQAARQSRIRGGRWGRHREAGFTLVELVVVMLLMAVLATVSASRLADREPFAAQAAADQVVSGLRLAQATATARRQTVYVQLGASPLTLSVCLDAGCTQPIPPPGGGSWLNDTEGLALGAAAAFSFDGAGIPSITEMLTLQVSAPGIASARPIRVEAGSGHVHQP